MTKFLRKYNKWLIAGFGSFLVMTWLVSGPGAFQSDPRKRAVATVGGKKLRAMDLGKSELEHRALQAYVPGVLMVAAGVSNGVHWHLLSQEAERAGFVGAAGDGVSWTEELVELETELYVRTNPQFSSMADMIFSQPSMLSQFQQQTRDRLEKTFDIAASQGQLQRTEFQQALAKLRGVVRMVSTFSGAPRLSDLRAIDLMGKAVTRVTFDAVSIPADRVANVASPTEEQLQALFDQYKGVKAGTGEFGFGYELPKRVKIQWLTLSKQAIESAIKLDPIEVNKYWQQNRTKFPGEFAAERSKVEDSLKAERTAKALDEADRVVRARISGATRNLKMSEGARVLPADWQTRRPTLDAIAAAVASDVKVVKLSVPTVVTNDKEFVAISDLAKPGAIGFADFRAGTFGGNITNLLEQTYELSGSNSIGLQVGIPYENHLTTPGGDHIYIVVLDASKESPAESLEMTRAAVIRDAKLLAGFEKLKADRDAFTALAAAEGLEAVAKAFPAPEPSTATPVATPTDLMIDRRVEMSATVTEQSFPKYNSQPLRDEILSQLNLVGLSVKPTPENIVLRTISVVLPAERSVAVIQITGWEPLSVERMRTATKSTATNLAAMELRESIKDGEADNPFSYENLKLRLQYISLEGGDTKAAIDLAKKEAEKRSAQEAEKSTTPAPISAAPAPVTPVSSPSSQSSTPPFAPAPAAPAAK